MLPRAQNDDQWGSKVRKYVNREVASEFCLFPSLDSNRLGNLFRTLVPIGKRCILFLLWIQAEPSCCITWRFPFLVQFVCLFECFRPAVPLCLREPPSRSIFGSRLPDRFDTSTRRLALDSRKRKAKWNIKRRKCEVDAAGRGTLWGAAVEFHSLPRPVEVRKR